MNAKQVGSAGVKCPERPVAGSRQSLIGGMARQDGVAGGQMDREASPKEDWARRGLRVLNLIDNQVRNLRKRQVIESYTR